MKTKADIFISKPYKPYKDILPLKYAIIIYPQYYLLVIAALIPILVETNISMTNYFLLCLLVWWICVMFYVCVICKYKERKSIHHSYLILEGIEYCVLSFNSNYVEYSMVLEDFFNEHLRDIAYNNETGITTLSNMKCKVYIDGKPKYKCIIIEAEGRDLFDMALKEGLIKRTEEHNNLLFGRVD